MTLGIIYGIASALKATKTKEIAKNTTTVKEIQLI